MSDPTTTPMDATHIHRAYVQGRVIETNLTHLAGLLSKAGSGLDDDLATFTHRFGRLVRRLEYANAAGQPRIIQADNPHDAPEKPEQAVGA